MTCEQDLVQLLRTDQCLAAMKELAGGTTATELGSARVSPQALDALMEGLHDENPRT